MKVIQILTTQHYCLIFFMFVLIQYYFSDISFLKKFFGFLIFYQNWQGKFHFNSFFPEVSYLFFWFILQMNFKELIFQNRRASLVAQMVESLPAMWETQVGSLSWEDVLEKEVATHSSVLAWRIPCMEEPGRIWFMESQRVRHN